MESSPCPCRAARLGAALLGVCIYAALWPQVFFGTSFEAVFAAAMHGDIPIRWTGIAVIGLLCLLFGLHEIREQGHGFVIGSFLWSILVIALLVWAVTVRWPSPAAAGVSVFGFHLWRAALIGWACGNAMNLIVQLRGLRGRRADDPPAPPNPARLMRRTRVTTEVTEEIEDHGIEALPLAHRAAMRLPPRVSADLIGRGALPQITYVRQPDGTFVPADDADAVPVRRR
jgi:hypothetical protein